MSHLWINCEFLFLVSFSIWHLSQPLNKFSETMNSGNNKACGKCWFICLLSCGHNFALLSFSNWIYNSSQHEWEILTMFRDPCKYLHGPEALEPTAYPLRHCVHCLEREPLMIRLHHSIFPDHAVPQRYNSTSVLEWNYSSYTPYEALIPLRNTEEPNVDKRVKYYGHYLMSQ